MPQIRWGKTKEAHTMASLVANRPICPVAEWNAAELSDEDLLNQYLSGTESDSQEAFRELVVRHGPMVLGICRHVLNQAQDAEDAFQGTFLALARNAATIRDRRVLAGWLHEVAYRIALRLRTSTTRRRALERQGMAMSSLESEPDSQTEHAAWNELRPVLHEEINRLPEKYRLPVILSYLEGKTNEEVAELLQWPLGTVKVRLMRAREALRSRLSRRGLALSAAFLMTALARGQVFAEVVPSHLLQKTLRLALTSRSLPVALDSPPSPSTDAPPGTELPSALKPTKTLIHGSARLSPIALIGLLFLVFSLSIIVTSSIAMFTMGGSSADFRSILRSSFDFRSYIPASESTSSCH
jgi:RNA polymerase sigma factor (sigma-70 family)